MSHPSKLHSRVAWLLGVVALLWAGSALRPVAAQTPLLTAEDQPVRVGVTPVAQTIDDAGMQTSELSTQIDLDIPIGESVRLTAQGAVARVQSDRGSSFSGIDDAQVGAMYARQAGGGSIVARLDLSLPIGKDELTRGELATVRSTSRSAYDFRVPSFGDGLAAVPRVSYAFPLGEAVVAGLGGAYQYLGSYRPVATASRDYDPGNGWEVFGGVDAQISRASSVSVDLRYARFGTAQAGGIDRLEPGNSYAGTVRYRYQMSDATLEVAAQVQQWEESSVRAFLVGPDAPTEASRQQLVPSRTLAQASYRRRVGDAVSVRLRLGGRYFEATDVTERQRVGVAGVRGAFRLSPAWTLAPFAAVTTGDFFGARGGVRTELQF